MLQSFYNVTEDQKYYYLNPIYRTLSSFELQFLRPSSCRTRDVCFGSRVSPIISFADPYFSILAFGTQVPCKISVPYLGSWVSPLISWVSVPSPTYKLVTGFRVPGLTHRQGPGSRVSDPTKSPGFWVLLFGYTKFFCKYYFQF